MCACVIVHVYPRCNYDIKFDQDYLVLLRYNHVNLLIRVITGYLFIDLCYYLFIDLWVGQKKQVHFENR